MKSSHMGGVVLASVGLLAGLWFLDVPAMLRPLPNDMPEMRALPAGMVTYRPIGDFRVEGRVTYAPAQTIAIPGNLELMRNQVSQEFYGKCVTAGGCKATQSSGAPDLPQTLVNYRDAQDFAAWQSARTGQTWRLPTGPEWTYAAAEKFVEDAVEEENPTSSDPAQRWLLDYRNNAKQRDGGDPTLRPLGAHPGNSFGIAGFGGNIWEWTTTCFESGEVDAEGRLIRKDSDYCGVRLAQGVHRAFIIDFVRDASVGGCAVGLPPDHLAIRLVREN